MLTPLLFWLSSRKDLLLPLPLLFWLSIPGIARNPLLHLPLHSLLR
jgi:hypothetical protein